MTTQKDFKRLVRGRMQKTGESYTAARAQLLRQKRNGESAKAPALSGAKGPALSEAKGRDAPPERPAALSTDYAKLAGMSDANLKKNTGCDWQRWVKALDRVDAHTWPHREIAKYVREKYKVKSWWVQTVTVGYERIKGLRAIGQRRDGSFEASKSRTFAVPVTRIYSAFHDARIRARWLPGVDLTVRTATRGKSMRITWSDRTSVVVGFTRLGAAKSQVALTHQKLPDRAAVTRAKEYWAARLDTLRQVLIGSTSK